MPSSITAARNAAAYTQIDLKAPNRPIADSVLMLQSPIRIAAMNGDYVKVKQLLDAGASPNGLIKQKFWVPRDNVFFAADAGDVKLMKLLLAAGADPNIAQDNTGKTTPLMVAAIRGDVEMTRLLLAAGAKVNARESDGSTALDYARTGSHANPAVAAMLERAHAKTFGTHNAEPWMNRGVDFVLKAFNWE